MKIEYEFDEEVWEYEPDERDLEKALVKLLMENVKEKEGIMYSEDGSYQMAMYVVHEIDTKDVLCEIYEDELKDYFYDDAEEDYRKAIKDAIAEEQEIADWYGTKSDVLGFKKHE